MVYAETKLKCSLCHDEVDICYKCKTKFSAEDNVFCELYHTKNQDDSYYVHMCEKCYGKK